MSNGSHFLFIQVNYINDRRVIRALENESVIVKFPLGNLIFHYFLEDTIAIFVPNLKDKSSLIESL